MEDDFDLILVPAPDEGVPAHLKRQQQKLRRLLLDAASKTRPLTKGRTKFRDSGMTLEASAAGVHLTDLQVLLAAAGTAATPLVTTIVAWLGGHYGRKVKVKAGDIEIEAGTAKEVLELMKQAQVLKQANEPKQTDGQ